MVNKILIISVIVIILISSIFAIFFLTQNSRDISNSSSSQFTNSQQETVPEIQQQVNKGSYENKEYELEFNYPTNWEISERTVQGDLSVKLFPDSNSNKGSLTISADVKPFDFCPDCTSLNEVKSKMTNSLQDSVQNLNSREISINENKAIEITYTTSYGYASKSIYLMKDDKIYTIAYLEGEEVADKYQTEYNKITDSFSII